MYVHLSVDIQPFLSVIFEGGGRFDKVLGLIYERPTLSLFCPQSKASFLEGSFIHAYEGPIILGTELGRRAQMWHGLPAGGFSTTGASATIVW